MPLQLTDDSVAWLSAAALLGDWPEAFTAFLEVYQTIDKHCSTSTGVGRGSAFYCAMPIDWNGLGIQDLRRRSGSTWLSITTVGISRER